MINAGVIFVIFATITIHTIVLFAIVLYRLSVVKNEDYDDHISLLPHRQSLESQSMPAHEWLITMEKEMECLS